MTLRILFTSISILLIYTTIFAQMQNHSIPLSLKVEAFNEEQIDLLFQKDSTYILIFINENKCIKCVETINYDIRKLINKNETLKVIYLIRVGDNALRRREVIDLIKVTINSNIPQYYFDFDNVNSVGIEKESHISGTFKKFNINRTPSLLLVKDNLVKVYQNDVLFNENGDLKMSLLKLFK